MKCYDKKLQNKTDFRGCKTDCENIKKRIEKKLVYNETEQLLIDDMNRKITKMEIKNVIDNNGEIACIKISDGNNYSRKQIDNLIDDAKKFGAKGLAFFRYAENEISTGIAKFLSDNEKSLLVEKLDLQNNDLCFVVADNYQETYEALGQIRLQLANQLNLVDKGRNELVWIVSFPLLEFSADENRYMARHHPFTSPVAEDIEKLESAPEKVNARAYDLVLNGNEIAGGSIRIHSTKLQERIFKTLGISDQEAREKFGFLLDALQYGAPPHGGDRCSGCSTH